MQKDSNVLKNVNVFLAPLAHPCFDESCTPHMKTATLVFLVKQDQVLLGMKKRGFGLGRWNGFGGKIEQNETIEQAAIRELEEETGVTASSLEKRGEITFAFPSKPEWNQIVHLFVVTKWTGEPVESEEMLPRWFSHNSLPFDVMWPADPLWLPHILAGKFVTARFVREEDQSTILEKEVIVQEK